MRAAVKRCSMHGADVNATETAQGQTALMFAAALDRADVVQVAARARRQRRDSRPR